jgi:hypothetical protein
VQNHSGGHKHLRQRTAATHRISKTRLEDLVLVLTSERSQQHQVREAVAGTVEVAYRRPCLPRLWRHSANLLAGLRMSGYL